MKEEIVNRYLQSKHHHSVASGHSPACLAGVGTRARLGKRVGRPGLAIRGQRIDGWRIVENPNGEKFEGFEESFSGKNGKENEVSSPRTWGVLRGTPLSTAVSSAGRVGPPCLLVCAVGGRDPRLAD